MCHVHIASGQACLGAPPPPILGSLHSGTVATLLCPDSRLRMRTALLPHACPCTHPARPPPPTPAPIHPGRPPPRHPPRWSQIGISRLSGSSSGGGLSQLSTADRASNSSAGSGSSRLSSSPGWAAAARRLRCCCCCLRTRGGGRPAGQRWVAAGAAPPRPELLALKGVSRRSCAALSACIATAWLPGCLWERPTQLDRRVTWRAPPDSYKPAHSSRCGSRGSKPCCGAETRGRGGLASRDLGLLSTVNSPPLIVSIQRLASSRSKAQERDGAGTRGERSRGPMAAVAPLPAAGGEGDWKAQLKLPPKDTRIQTEVIPCPPLGCPPAPNGLGTAECTADMGQRQGGTAPVMGCRSCWLANRQPRSLSEASCWSAVPGHKRMPAGHPAAAARRCGRLPSTDACVPASAAGCHRDEGQLLRGLLPQKVRSRAAGQCQAAPDRTLRVAAPEGALPPPRAPCLPCLPCLPCPACPACLPCPACPAAAPGHTHAHSRSAGARPAWWVQGAADGHLREGV